MDYTYKDQIKCNVSLLNKELWDSFSNLNTEMIITKPGRRMFPAMRVQVEHLEPNKEYCILVEMVPVGNCRFRYSASTGWAPAGAEEAQSPNRVYVHPESPAPGHYWMSQAVSFGRMKLTNTTNPPGGHVVMSSMHKYQPKIIVIEASDVRMIHDFCPNAMFSFPQTQFIAVTAYQNDKMTKMKIDHNPFAKGFRESGQAKCKRKRQRIEQEQQQQQQRIEKTTKEQEEEDSVAEDELVVVDELRPAKRLALSPALDSSHSSVSTDSGMSDCDRSLTTSPGPRQNSRQSYNPDPLMTYMQPTMQPTYRYDTMYPYYFGYQQVQQYYPYMAANTLNSSSYLPHQLNHAQDLTVTKHKAMRNVEVEVVKCPKKNKPDESKSKSKEELPPRTKFTDFSIRAITGFA